MRQLAPPKNATLSDTDRHALAPHTRQRRTQIDSELRNAGAVAYNFWLPETRTLPSVIHPDEHIRGIVYGRYKQDAGLVTGRGALVATDHRVLLLDKKLMFIRVDEISYMTVTAVTYGHVGPVGTVVLHTRMGDISVRTFNRSCAEHFVAAIKSIIFTQDNVGDILWSPY